MFQNNVFFFFSFIMSWKKTTFAQTKNNSNTIIIQLWKRVHYRKKELLTNRNCRKHFRVR
ncbi:unknown [Prevotella sp. CAG:487]|nr:unknown [Prevotella sp. CAG:487]